MEKSLRVTNWDVSKYLVDYIFNGQEFHTPVRDCGMITATWGYVGGFRSSTVHSHIKKMDGKTYYVVYSYTTPIMRVEMEELDDGSWCPKGAEFDNRKYSSTTRRMQKWCHWALREIFALGWIPDVIGKRGGRHVRHNFMAVYGSYGKGFNWGVLDIEDGEIIPLNQDGDGYNGDTEGYY